MSKTVVDLMDVVLEEEAADTDLCMTERKQREQRRQRRQEGRRAKEKRAR